MRPLLIVIITALASCSPELAAPGKTGVVTPPVTAPIRTQPVTDSVARVSQSIDHAGTRAADTGTALDRASKATDEALSLANQNAAMRAALDQVVASLNAARSSNGELLKELDTLKGERETLTTAASSLSADIALKEAEVSALRQSVHQANQDLQTSASKIESLNKANAGLIEKSASAGVYRAWIIGAVILLVIVVLAKAALKFYRIPMP